MPRDRLDKAQAMTRDDQHGRNWPGVYLSRRLVAAVRIPLPRGRPRVCSCGPKPRTFSRRAMSWPSRAKTSLRSLPRGISAPKSLKMSGYAASRALLIAASEASISRRRRPPRSTNAFGSSPTGVQPSSAIRLLAKLRTIEKADEKEAQREASSFIVTSENRTPIRHIRPDMVVLVGAGCTTGFVVVHSGP